MKKQYFSIMMGVFLSLCVGLGLKAQPAGGNLDIGVGIDLLDFYSPANSTLFNMGQLNLGPAVDISARLNPSLSLGGRVGIFDIDNYVNEASHIQRTIFVDVGGILKYHLDNGYLIREGARIAPYLYAGGSLNWISEMEGTDQSQFGFDIPLGLGINFWASERVAVYVQTGYNIGITDNNDNHQHHSIGLRFNLGGDRIKDLPPPPPAPDADGDGIADSEDECPNEAGILQFMGCPDTDGDGIANKNDDCPEAAGPALTKGCPDTDGDGVVDNEDACPEVAGTLFTKGCPDTDGDGLADNVDECPNKAGSKATNGCPDSDMDGVPDVKDRCPAIAGSPLFDGCPDSDGDGIADIDDECPNSPGSASSRGCPVITTEVKEQLEFAAQNIQFEQSSSTLKTSSHQVLDEIAEILNQYADFNVKIGGHTDSQGPEDANMELSQKRAQSAKNYLVSKGIKASRMTAVGYGESNPIGDNRYASGRAKNRRVEIELVR